MVLPNYEQLIEKIASAAGISKEEVDRQVEAKCAKLSGLISKEGSAQIVASELGISFDKEKFKIDEIVSGMKKVSVTGKVIDEPRINSFTTKAGNEGKVASMTIADDTNNIRLVLWDTNHIALFEEGKLKKDDVIDISNGSVRNDEIHLSGFSEIKLSNDIIENVVLEKKMVEKNIKDLQSGNSARLRAFIVQMFEPKFFEVCPQCGRKPAANNECNTHGTIVPEKRALLSIVLDDGSENMRAVMFQEAVERFGITKEELDNPEIFAKKKLEFLGKEAFFNVTVRTNAMFNNTEMTINGVDDIEIDPLIDSLRG